MRPTDFQHSEFLDSIIVEELDMDTMPAELLAAFEDSQIGHVRDEVLDPDFWGKQNKTFD